ncbi:hypothetical protein DMUE_3714 [Dictyocoela muelleri]|nr:hypothetical protein DMUE_3714 [Dictyocoela muelleri]
MYKCLLEFFRLKISKYINKNKRQLGGLVKEVQIDESYWTKAKYGYGRWGKGVCICGAVRSKTDNCHLELIYNRDKKTLIPLINKYIKKIHMLYLINGQHIILLNKGIGTLSYINTILWIHKQKLTHKRSKAIGFKKKHYTYGISLKTLPQHLDVFMFFRNYKDIKFSEFLEIILN